MEQALAKFPVGCGDRKTNPENQPVFLPVSFPTPERGRKRENRGQEIPVGVGNRKQEKESAGQPVSIYGHACLMTAFGGGYVITHDGIEVARAERRLLAVARAGAALTERPARAVKGLAP